MLEEVADDAVIKLGFRIPGDKSPLYDDDQSNAIKTDTHE